MPRTAPEVTYTVELSRRAEFPLDMLRKDFAQAATPEDERLIRVLSKGLLSSEDGDEEARAALPKRVLVRLKSGYRGAAHVERWESFRCKVTTCSDMSRLPFRYVGARENSKSTGQGSDEAALVGSSLALQRLLDALSTYRLLRAGSTEPVPVIMRTLGQDYAIGSTEVEMIDGHPVIVLHSNERDL